MNDTIIAACNFVSTNNFQCLTLNNGLDTNEDNITEAFSVYQYAQQPP